MTHSNESTTNLPSLFEKPLETWRKAGHRTVDAYAGATSRALDAQTKVVLRTRPNVVRAFGELIQRLLTAGSLRHRNGGLRWNPKLPRRQSSGSKTPET